MTLQKREKILAIASATLLVVLAAYWFWPSQGGSIADLRREQTRLQTLLNKNELLDRQVKKAKIRMEALQVRSLPAELETARLLYKSWLLELANRAGINPPPTLTVTDGQPVKGVYLMSNFSIQCQCTLEQLTKFLHDFYSSSHLHKIRTLIINPAENSSQLKLNILIEAMSLPGATQKDKLSDKPNDRLKLTSLDDYKKLIVNRNLFAAYAVKPPVVAAPVREKPKVDPLELSYLTAIIEANGIPEAWLFDRTSGENIPVHEGEEFTIAKLKGKVNRIGNSDIDIEIDGKSGTVTYGSNLKLPGKPESKQAPGGKIPGTKPSEPKTADAKPAGTDPVQRIEVGKQTTPDDRRPRTREKRPETTDSRGSAQAPAEKGGG
jgi:hypothetical protein